MDRSDTGTKARGIEPEDVHSTLQKHMLADGMPIVFDATRSRGAWLFDSLRGENYLNLFSFFASQPLGHNHPRMHEPDFLARLLESAISKPTNSDVYTTAMASFVRTFAETAIPESHRRRLFFVEGGALGVENALKCAFDWKYRLNRIQNGPDTENLEVLHFRKAFHGRSGYTLSLTNTADPRKYQYFPRFDWPRVDHPSLRFPLDREAIADVEAAEAASLAAIRRAFDERKGRIACIIIETIQAEGGDNHARPEFLRALREVCDERDALLVFDEVQAGMGLTGDWWAWQTLGVEPDLFAFGKKTQVCGFASNDRVDRVSDNVFRLASRINSTWGGNLVDMVRCEQYVRVIAEEGLLANARRIGARVLAGLERVQAETAKIANVRGRGLMIAFDLPSAADRDALRKRLFDAKVILLACGERSIRFRPALDLSAEDGDRAVQAIRAAL